MSATSERIKSLVESTGLSQREIARRIGVSNVSLSQWVSGKNEPSKENLEGLCEFFSVTPAFILYGTGNAPMQTIQKDDGSISIPLIDIQVVVRFLQTSRLSASCVLVQSSFVDTALVPMSAVCKSSLPTEIQCHRRFTTEMP